VCACEFRPAQVVGLSGIFAFSLGGRAARSHKFYEVKPIDGMIPPFSPAVRSRLSALNAPQGARSFFRNW